MHEVFPQFKKLYYNRMVGTDYFQTKYIMRLKQASQTIHHNRWSAECIRWI